MMTNLKVTIRGISRIDAEGIFSVIRYVFSKHYNSELNDDDLLVEHNGDPRIIIQGFPSEFDRSESVARLRQFIPDVDIVIE